MADEQNTYGKIAIAGDIAKIQHGMYFSDVEYYCFDNEFKILSAVKHYVSYKPFYLAGSQQLKLDVDDQSCSWNVNSQEFKFLDFYNDGISSTTSAFMKNFYNLSVTYIPNYEPTIEKNKIDLVANCNYLDADNVEYIQTSATNYMLKNCPFRRIDYRCIGWSKISAAFPEDILPISSNVVLDSNASFYANWRKQCNVTIQCYPMDNNAFVVWPKPINNKYDISAMLSVEAFPALHYDFGYWKIYDEIFKTSSTQFQLSSENTEIDAYFTKHQYKLTLNVFGENTNVEYAYDDGRSGTLSGISNDLQITHFDVVQFVAKDTMTQMFVMWNSDKYPIEQYSDRGLVIKELTSDAIVNAIFGDNRAGVNVLYNKNFGSVHVKIDDGEYEQTDYAAVPEHSIVTLSANEVDGCKFIKWINLTTKDECSSVEYELTDVLYLNTISAYFDTWLIANDDQQPIMCKNDDNIDNIDDSILSIKINESED